MASLEQGQQLLAGQRYEVLGHAVDGETVVTRVRWTGTLALVARTPQWRGAARLA